MAAMTTSSRAIMTTIMIERKELTPSPVTKYFHAWIKAPGRAEMILTVMMIDEPLPMPRSVIWSAIHNKNTLPATMVSTVITIHNAEGSGTRLPKRSMPDM